MAKSVLITGTSSGIGFATAKFFSEKGWNVAATMRKPSSEAGQQLSQLQNTHVFPLDVTDQAAVAKAVQSTVDKFGSVDVVVNNAGYGLSGPFEFATAEQIERQYATNVYGPVYLMQAVLPHMRKSGSGVIINVTSAGGRIALPFCSLYHGTKFALEGISESANLELAPLGIRVRIVEPGGVKTAFSGRSMVMTTSESVKDYDKMLGNAVQEFGANMSEGSEPSHIAGVIFDAATDDSDQLRYPAGEDAKVMLNNRYAMSDEEYQKSTTERFHLND